MWLPKDERKLLTAYYVKIHSEKGLEDVAKEKWYQVSDLINILRSPNLKKAAKKLPDQSVSDAIRSNSQDECNIEKLKKEIKDYLHYETKVNVANSKLERRGLITIRDVRQKSWRGISLNIHGYDLGEKYSCWFTRTGVAYQEYKKHWIWVVVGFLLGILATLIVSWLSK